MIGRFFRRISEFLSEVRSEIKKVSFPTRAETIGSTGVVLILVAMVSFFLSVLDRFLVQLVKLLIG